MATYAEMRAEYQALTGQAAPMFKAAELEAKLVEIKAKLAEAEIRAGAEKAAAEARAAERAARIAQRGSFAEFAALRQQGSPEDQQLGAMARKALGYLDEAAKVKANFDTRWASNPTDALYWIDLQTAAAQHQAALDFQRLFNAGLSYAEIKAKLQAFIFDKARYASTAKPGDLALMQAVQNLLEAWL